MTISEKIIKTREELGLTQEKLAELSKLSLRTIQRIENNETTPRGQTLDLISKALNIELKQFLETKSNINGLDIVFIILFNFLLVAFFGYFTMDVHANINSQVASLFLSLSFGVLLVLLTPNYTPLKRTLYFGLGLPLYCIAITIIVDFPKMITSFVFFDAVILLTLQYYGTILIKGILFSTKKD